VGSAKDYDSMGVGERKTGNGDEAGGKINGSARVELDKPGRE